MVSVAMAVYNGEKYIDKQLFSIVNQTLIPDEIVITDDSDNDDTYQIIKEYIIKYDKIKWNYIKNTERLGYCRNFFKALSLTSGDIVFLSDQDDIWDRDKISKMTNCMLHDKNIMCLCSKYILIDKDDNEISGEHEYSTSDKYNKDIKRFTYFKLGKNEYFKILAFPGFCFAINEKLRKDLNTFLKSIDINKIKYHDLIISFLSSRVDAFYIYNEVLNKYRMHGTNAIGIEEFNDGKKQDRIEWLRTILNNQKELLSYEIDLQSKVNTKDNENVEILNSLIDFNSKRIDYLSNKRIINTFKLVFNLNKYLSIKSYFGDLLYIIKS